MEKTNYFPIIIMLVLKKKPVAKKLPVVFTYNTLNFSLL